MGCSKSKHDSEDSEDASPRQPTFHKSLSALRGIPTLYMHQDLPDNIAVCCKGNTYTLEDQKGMVLFHAVEESFCNACCGRWCCGPARGFTMKVNDADTEDNILSAERAACRCDWWCCLDCFLCAHRIIIRDANNEFVGRVIQKFACAPLLSIENEVQEEIAKVRGPHCVCRCCCDQVFNIFTPLTKEMEEEDEEDAMQLNGHMIKHWEPGVFIESQPKSINDVNDEDEKKKGRYYNMDHEHSQVIFPENSDDNNKALLLGAHFLVNYMYFEMS